LRFAGIEPNENELLARFLDADRGANGRAFVGAENALEVRVRLDVCLGDFGRLEVVARAVLDADNLDVAILSLDPVDEAVAAVDAGTARLGVDDGGDFAGPAGRPRPPVRRGCPGPPPLPPPRGWPKCAV